MDIADLFRVSVDSLLGRKNSTTGSLTPRRIAGFIVQMIENDDAEFFDYEKEEDIYEAGYDEEVTNRKRKIKYPALYLPSYWHISEYVDPDEEQYLYSEMCSVGNESAMMDINNFLQHFREIYPIYKKGDLSEDTYHAVVEDMLSNLRD